MTSAIASSTAPGSGAFDEQCAVGLLGLATRSLGLDRAERLPGADECARHRQEWAGVTSLPLGYCQY